jgi:hypothetical protein
MVLLKCKSQAVFSESAVSKHCGGVDKDGNVGLHAEFGGDVVQAAKMQHGSRPLKSKDKNCLINSYGNLANSYRP